MMAGAGREMKVSEEDIPEKNNRFLERKGN